MSKTMEKFKYNIGDEVRVIESGIVGKVVKIGDDQHNVGKNTFKIKGYEEMWFREDELDMTSKTKTKPKEGKVEEVKRLRKEVEELKTNEPIMQADGSLSYPYRNTHKQPVKTKPKEGKTRVEESFWEVIKDEETGKKYWSGGCLGDKDKTDFDLEKPLKCSPKHFPVGYTIIGYEPKNE